jgi:hypothetical protein
MMRVSEKGVCKFMKIKGPTIDVIRGGVWNSLKRKEWVNWRVAGRAGFGGTEGDDVVWRP